MGANWNSKENKHTPIVKEGTNHKASQVKAMVEERYKRSRDSRDYESISKQNLRVPKRNPRRRREHKKVARCKKERKQQNHLHYRQ